MPERNENPPQRAQPSEAGEQRRAQAKRHLDERLDEALEETFPASDPIAVTPPRERPLSHRAPRDG